MIYHGRFAQQIYSYVITSRDTWRLKVFIGRPQKTNWMKDPVMKAQQYQRKWISEQYRTKASRVDSSWRQTFGWYNFKKKLITMIKQNGNFFRSLSKIKFWIGSISSTFLNIQNTLDYSAGHCTIKNEC